jgi:2-dehydro-3-deoxygluconokinase
VTRVLCIGECMLELRRVDAATMRLGHAGDTYNTAVYLRRVAEELGVDVSVGYLSGVGDDAHSAEMRAAWRDEGVEDRAIVVPGRTPGLYIVQTDADGERSFAYWRRESAAHVLFCGTQWVSVVEADLVYLSGITLQLMAAPVRAALLARLDLLRRGGARVALDTNYRPAGWPSAEVAAAAIGAAAARADTVFTSLEDELALRAGDGHVAVREPAPGTGSHDGRAAAVADVAARRGRSAAEVVVKDGAAGVWLGGERLPAVAPERVVDTTAAGDALAGAYLAARLGERDPRTALELAIGVAARVIAHPGALTPRAVRLTGEPADAANEPRMAADGG